MNQAKTPSSQRNAAPNPSAKKIAAPQRRCMAWPAPGKPAAEHSITIRRLAGFGGGLDSDGEFILFLASESGAAQDQPNGVPVLSIVIFSRKERHGRRERPVYFLLFS